MTQAWCLDEPLSTENLQEEGISVPELSTKFNSTLDGEKIDIFHLGATLVEMIMEEPVFTDFSEKDSFYTMFKKDLLSNSKGAKFFGALGKLLQTKENFDIFD